MISLQRPVRAYDSPSVHARYHANMRYQSEEPTQTNYGNINTSIQSNTQARYSTTNKYYDNGQSTQPSNGFSNSTEWNTPADAEAYIGHANRAHEDINDQFLDSTGPCYHLAPAFVEYTLALWEQECSSVYKADLLKLVTKLVKNFDVCESALIVTMVYLQRLKTRFDECGFNAEKCSVQISVVCMMVATKFLYDIPTVNSLWAELSDITTADINQMELELLRATNYSLAANEIEADTARRTLNSWIRITEQNQINKSNRITQSYTVNPVNRTPPYASPSVDAVYSARWSPLQEAQNDYRHDLRNDITEYNRYNQQPERHDSSAYAYADYTGGFSGTSAMNTQTDEYGRPSEIYRSDSGVLVGGMGEHRGMHCSTDSGMVGCESLYQPWSSGANNMQAELPSENPRWEAPNNDGSMSRRDSSHLNSDSQGYLSFGNANASAHNVHESAYAVRHNLQENVSANDVTYGRTDLSRYNSMSYPQAHTQYTQEKAHQPRTDNYAVQRSESYIDNPYGSAVRRSVSDWDMERHRAHPQSVTHAHQQVLAHDNVDWSYSGNGSGTQSSYFH